MMRTHVYVDGFNLYYGLLRHSPHRRLDLEAMFDRLFGHHQVRRIHYFTADIPASQGGSEDQATYLRALESLPRVHIAKGFFATTAVECTHGPCGLPRPRVFERHTEKRTDVKIGSQIIEDVVKRRCDKVALVSADTDLLPAMETAMRLAAANVKFELWPPATDQGRLNAMWLQGVDKKRPLPPALLAASQFPDRVQTLGHDALRPATW